jgi:aspartate racemase
MACSSLIQDRNRKRGRTLVGGIGTAATDYYYRRIVSVFLQKSASLDLTIVHADTRTLLDNQSGNHARQQAEGFAALTHRLADGGADFVAVTSVAGHFCRKEFEALSSLPVVDMIDVVNRAVSESGMERIGILGTRVVMASRFYGGIKAAELLLPDGADLDHVHDAYVAMAVVGKVTADQRRLFQAVATRLIQDQGAEAIMLGGTDLALVFDEQSCPFSLIDCAAVHADAIAQRGLSSHERSR